jgi:hypothetical protein
VKIIRVVDVGNLRVLLSAVVPRESMPRARPEGLRHTISLSETNQSSHSSDLHVGDASIFVPWHASRYASRTREVQITCESTHRTGMLSCLNAVTGWRSDDEAIAFVAARLTCPAKYKLGWK